MVVHIETWAYTVGFIQIPQERKIIYVVKFDTFVGLPKTYFRERNELRDYHIKCSRFRSFLHIKRSLESFE